MTNLEKFNELVERVRAGLSCKWTVCLGSSCPYYEGDCIESYREDVHTLTMLLVRMDTNADECGFGEKEYKE